MLNPNVKRVKDTVESIELGDHLDIVSYIHVWSNGSKVRRYASQDNLGSYNKGYRKMVAILVEIEDEINNREE